MVVGGMHGCGGVCIVAGRGACMVAGGQAWLWGCTWLQGWHAWLWGHAWLQGVCVVVGVCMVVGGMHGCRGHAWLWGACMVVGGGACVVAGGAYMGYDEIQSMSGQYKGTNPTGMHSC